jgi:hypothetical protein
MAIHGVPVPALLLLLATLSTASAQAPTGITYKRKFKDKPKSGASWILVDKSKPVRHALESRYASIREAYFTNNPDGAMAFRSPDLAVLMPNGQRLSRDESDAYIRKAFTVVQGTISLSFDIDSLEVSGDTAVALIHQHWVRRQEMAGQLRMVDTQAHQHETWVNTPEGWQLFRIDDIRPGPWFVDGKQIDPLNPR